MSDDDSPLEQLVAGVVVGAILLTAFTLLALDVSWFWVAFPVGFAGVLPAAIALVRLYERREEGTSTDTATGDEAALETLRDRYARGELTEEEFEARVEQLLETGSVAEAREYVDRRRRDRTGEDAAGTGAATGEDAGPPTGNESGTRGETAMESTEAERRE